MNFGLFLLALRARLGLFIGVLCATVISAAAVSLMMEKSYRATASLLMDVKDEQSLNSALRPLMMRQEMVGYLQTQTDIIKSEKVARRVVEDLGLARDPLLIRKFQESGDHENGKNGSLDDWLVESLHQGLEVETSQSSVIRVIYTANSPKLCAAIANAFANSYIATVLELRVEPAREAASWFDEQLKSLRANLEDAQAKLTDYHRANGIISVEERDDVEHAQLGALSSQLSASREQAALWTAKEKQARDAVAQGGSLEKLPEVVNNPLVQKLKEDLLRGEARLQQLSTQYGVNHPQYERLASENAAMRQKLDAETQNLVAGIGAVARLSRQHEQELRTAMSAQRSRVLDLKGDRNELTVLRRNAESAEHAYDAAMQRFVVSQVDSRANQTNISVLNPADEPLKPYRPKVFQNIVLAGAVGVMLGIGLVLLIELFDRRVRARTDLDLGVPLLAVINAWQPSGGVLGRPRLTRALLGQG